MFGNEMQKVEHYVAKKNCAKLIGLLKAKDEAVRVAAIKGLGQMTDEDAFNTLTSLLGSDKAVERAAAAEALGDSGMERAASFISHRVTTETDQAAKDAMSAAMIKLRKHAM